MKTLVPLLLLGGLVAAQDRMDPWTRLQRMDADGDGKVSREEFRGPDRFWERLDADADGFVTEEEAKAMRRGAQGGPGGRVGDGGAAARAFDADGDGKVTEAEWSRFFATADVNGDGVLDREELAAALGGRSYNDTAPKVGDAAPGVKAKAAADGREVDLSGAGDRPTVLVFGSWT